jgi:type VI secretion system protein ImpA
MPVNTELLTALLAPIPGENPSGADLRYDARVDPIKDARREDPYHEDPSQRKYADWQLVISGLTPLLTKETKDLQFMAWLAEALVRKQGYGGLATGLSALHGVLAQFWDTCYPLPEDDDLEVRVGPLEWVGGNLAIPLRLASFGPAPFSFLDHQLSRSIPTETEAESESSKRATRTEALEQGRMAPETVDAAIDAMNKGTVRAVLADVLAIKEALAALEAIADERFGRDAPSFLPLRSAVDDIHRLGSTILAEKLETDPDPIEIEEESATAEGAVAADPSAPMAPEPTSRADAAGRIAVVAKWYRKEDPTNPAPYAMVRGFRWGELRVSAPELDPKLLEAPPTAMRSRLKGLMLDGKWSDLLELGESLMATPQGRGWLDLQRYALTACANLGAGYDPVAAVMRAELRALLAAVPTLPEMTLMDDTPTANGETREWLASEDLLPPPADETAVPVEGEESADVEAEDGADVMMDALDDDHRTAENGGLAKMRRGRPRVVGRDPFELARNELAQGRPNRAIELLVTELQRERSPRGHFVRQTQIAYIMVEAGLDAVAHPILQRLIETIDEKGLEQWEAGALVAQPMALMCRVIDRTDGDASERYQLYLRVCRLDPLQALALQAR